MNNYDIEKTYVLLRGSESVWKNIEAGKILDFAIDKIKNKKLCGFLYDPDEKILYGQINFADKIPFRIDEIVDTFEPCTDKPYEKEEKRKDLGLCSWAIESFIKIHQLYIEGLDDFGDNKVEKILNEEEAKNFLTLINENYLGQVDFEQEIKFFLDQETFEKIYHNFVSEKNPKRQVNYYFNPEPLVKDKSTTIRIREKDGRYTLTVKEKKADAKDLSTEKSATISKDEFEKIMADGFLKVDAYLKNSLKGEVPYLGSLETIRDEVKYKNIALAFDKSSYFNKVDFEIEMEGPQNNISELRKTLGLDELKPNDLSKFGRFLRALEEK